MHDRNFYYNFRKYIFYKSHSDKDYIPLSHNNRQFLCQYFLRENSETDRCFSQYFHNLVPRYPSIFLTLNNIYLDIVECKRVGIRRVAT